MKGFNTEADILYKHAKAKKYRGYCDLKSYTQVLQQKEYKTTSTVQKKVIGIEISNLFYVF